MILTPGELQVGMYVSVLEWIEDRTLFGGIGVYTEAAEDRKELVGECLEIKALSLPFLACKHLSGQIISIDTRAARLCPVTAEFAEAFGMKKAPPDTPMCRSSLIPMGGVTMKIGNCTFHNIDVNPVGMGETCPRCGLVLKDGPCPRCME